MNTERIRTIIGKEWQEVITNRTIVGTFLLMLAIFMGMPLVLALVLPSAFGGEITQGSDIDQMVALLEQAFPQFANLPPLAKFQVFMLRQFLVLFLLLPIMGAMSIATYSIVGEKTTRSLEALLATPITTAELLLGKSLAAAVPPVIGTWIGFLIYAGIVRVVAGPQVVAYALDAAAWVTMLLITPLAAILALGLGVIISSRVNDPRTAQQVGGLLILPLVVVMIGQATGLFLLGLPFVLIGALALIVVDLVIVGLGVSLFNREQILTRWR